MQSQILPISISNPFIPSSSSSSGSSSSAFSIMPISSATAGAILLKSEEYNDVDGGDVLIRSSSIEDGKNIETKSFLPRVSSHDGSYTSPVTTTTSFISYQQRRRRAASDSAVSVLGGGRRRIFGQNDWRVDWDASVIVRCGHSTLRYIGVGFRWIIRFLALGCYSILIMPGVLQVAYYYYFSKQIRRDIVFGDQPRNKLDIFLPKNDGGKNDGPKPVIAFITGGAWIIGYKAWGSLLGHHLSDRDIIVACIDYRNFPKATITDMVKDASQGISFVCNNIAEYGGDPNRIYLMGQSAGAHIAACALMEQAIKESGGKERISWSPSQLKAYFGLSGAYNLLNLVDHFNNRGLHKSLFLSIMGGEESLQRYSPEVMAQDPNIHNAVSLLPPVVLFHGTADYSIPADSSRTFAETLQRHGVKADLMLYEEKTHTDVFVQDPMRGDDKMFDDLVTIIHAGDEEALAKHAKAPPRKRLVPECMLQLARRVSPF